VGQEAELLEQAQQAVGAGQMAFFDDDFPAARAHLESAFKHFRDAGDLRSAARVAADIAEIHGDLLGNKSAARGWVARGMRLVEQIGPGVEAGYLELAMIACEIPDVVALGRSADRALALAIEFGDADLEVRALADSGLALVSQGRTREGFGRLDEAMAAISAGGVDPLVSGKSFCAMLSACDRAGELERASEWTRIVTESVLEPNDGRPRVLHTHCREAYGSVLCTIGRWDDGEAAILEALGPNGSASISHRVEAMTRLADLRLLQGRADEAASLLRPHEDQLQACGPLARLHTLQGDHDLAAATIARGLNELSGDHLRESVLVSLLVEVHLARDDIDGATAACARLSKAASESDTPVLRAMASLASGRVAAARADADVAMVALVEARDALAPDERPVLAGTIRYEMARVLAVTGDTAAAVSEARAALAIFDRLGAAVDRDRTAALLRNLGARAPAGGRTTRAHADTLTPREREVLDLLRQGLTNAEIGNRLFISAKTAEHHVGRVLTKLGVRSRAEAAALAVSLGPGEAG
jgi:DNA-binding CsgD family transcriptional regulator